MPTRTARCRSRRRELSPSPATRSKALACCSTPRRASSPTSWPTRPGQSDRNVNFDDHPNDVAMREHAFKQGSAVYHAVDATRVFRTPPYPSTHNLGTNRMSAKAGNGVVNKHGQTHDIKNLFIADGSQFTTAASENPTLTIVSL